MAERLGSNLRKEDRTVRVFISSTFRDMQAERDHLVTVVFPELRERVESLGLEFFDVDLRWGVPETGLDGEKANSWEYCKRWIDRVEPFFVCMLGQRYGWVPRPHEITDDEDRRLWAGRSVTDMEIRHAVLSRRVRRRSSFYLRETPVPEPPRTDPAICGEFVDTDPISFRNLEQLKAEIRACGRPVRPYACRWTGKSFEDLDAFGRLVLDDLWSGVLRDERYVSEEVWQQALGSDPDADPRYTDESKPVPPDLAAKLVALATPPPKDPLDAEREQMEAFAQTRLRWFQGRTHELQQLAEFIASTGETAPRLAVVAAVPGQGKSALIARLHQLLSELPQKIATAESAKSAKKIEKDSLSAFLAFFRGQSPLVITHFVGATERSATVHALVQRLLDELDRSGIEWPADEQKEGEEPKRDFNSLCHRLRQRLGDYAGDRRIVILLDALNQLTDGHDLHWLPNRLGPGVRVVVSCIESEGVGCQVSAVSADKAYTPEQRVWSALTARHPAPLRAPLSPLTEDDIRTIVVEYLKEYCHELDRQHLEAVCAIPQARNPLYLLVMLNELRTLGGNDLNVIVPARIASMSRDYPDTVALFRWVLQRLEVFGSEAVKWWCLYLAHGRVGMASQELADLLARKLGADARTTALRIERGLRRFLLRRGGQLDFFHGQLRQAVAEQYGEPVSRRGAEAQRGTCQIHGEMADYFRDLADPEKNRSWNGGSTRPFGELPFHLVQARSWAELALTLRDVFFLEAKVARGLAFDLVCDFAEAVRQLPRDHRQHRILSLLEQALRRDIHFVARHAKDYPQALFQCLWNSCWWYDCPQKAQYHVDAKAPGRARPMCAPSPDEPKLCHLLQSWRSSKEQKPPGFFWLRSLRPPWVHLGTAQLSVLYGHEGDVFSVAYSPDGRRIVSGSEDNTVRLWDAASGAELAVLHGHGQFVRCVGYSADGWRIASGSHDNTVRVWDAVSGAELAVLRGHEQWVFSVGYSPDGRRIVSGSGDKTVRVWDAVAGAEVSVLRGHESPVLSVAFSPDGRRIVSGSVDGTARVWDAASGVELAVLRAHESPVLSVAYSPDGRRIISGSEDNTARVWDATSGAELTVLRGHQKGVFSVGYSPDGGRIVSGSGDKTVRVWDAANGAELTVLCGHEECVWSVGYSPDGGRIVSGSFDGTVRVWDAASRTELAISREHESLVVSVGYSPDGGRIVSGSYDRTVRVWDATNGAELAVLRGHEGDVSSVAYSPDGRHIVSGSYDRTARVWDAASGAELAVLRGHEGWVGSVAYSLDGRHIVSGSGDKTARVWDALSGAELMVLRGHKGDVSSVAYSPDGRRTVSGSDDKTARVWDAASGVELAVLRGHESPVLSVAYSPDGRRIVSGSDDKTARVWDAVSGAESMVLRGHKGGVESVAYSPDGRRIVSGSRDNTARVWDATSGACLEVIQGDGDVKAIAANPPESDYRALLHEGETVVQESVGRQVVARFPDWLWRIATHPLGRMWVGQRHNHVVILSLEVDRPVDQMLAGRKINPGNAWLI